MSDPTSPKTLLALWPSHETCADDIGVTVWAVRKWAWRGRIPAEFWAALVRSAEERGLAGVNLETLASMHAKGAARPEPVEARA